MTALRMAFAYHCAAQRAYAEQWGEEIGRCYRLKMRLLEVTDA